MDRRSFLSASGAAAFASLLDHEPLAPEPAPEPAPRAPHWLVQAAARAKAIGKPLLILHPIEPATTWSDFFGYGSDQDLCPLAASEIVCASPAEVLGAFPESEGHPQARVSGAHYRLAPPRIALLVETDGQTLSFHGRREPRGLATTLGDGVDPDDAWEGRTLANNTQLAGSLRGLLAPGREVLYRRFEQYKEAHRGKPSSGFFPADVDPKHVAQAGFISMHAPSILRWIALAEEPPAHLVHAMAEAVRCKAWHQPPPGAKWAHQYGDGPPQGRSILEFLTSGDSQ